MKRGFSITKKSTLWLTIGAVAAVVSWVLFATNVKLSIDFTGGVHAHTTIPLEEENTEKIFYAMAEKNNWKLQDVSIKTDQNGSDLLLKMSLTDQETKKAIDTVKQVLLDSQSIASTDQVDKLSFIGPSIGEFIKDSAIKALVVGILLMAVYMMFSFSDIRKVIPPYILAIITVVTMLFDISIPSGMYGLWMAFDPTIQVDSIFIIAILTTIGYSINDTIIILDRIKENALTNEKNSETKNTIANLIDKSVRQTMRRSLGTSLSTLIVVIAMFIIGDGVIQQFAYVIGWGIVAGTFSSIFISATSLYVLTKKTK